MARDIFVIVTRITAESVQDNNEMQDSWPAILTWKYYHYISFQLLQYIYRRIKYGHVYPHVYIISRYNWSTLSYHFQNIAMDFNLAFIPVIKKKVGLMIYTPRQLQVLSIKRYEKNT